MHFTKMYKRQDGTSFKLRIDIDDNLIADQMAAKMATYGHSKRNALGGGVKAEIVA